MGETDGLLVGTGRLATLYRAGHACRAGIVRGLLLSPGSSTLHARGTAVVGAWWEDCRLLADSSGPLDSWPHKLGQEECIFIISTGDEQCEGMPIADEIGMASHTLKLESREWQGWAPRC